MRFFTFAIFFLTLFSNSSAQTALQKLLNTERAFIRLAAENGRKAAFLAHLAESGIIFAPDAVNGKQFWTVTTEAAPSFELRKNTLADVSSNGTVGYTTGSWELYSKDKTGTPDSAGQYATIWEKRPDGRFWITLDIIIRHSSFPVDQVDNGKVVVPVGHSYKKGYSAADAAMNFLRTGMGEKGLGVAYTRFAAPEVRLLRAGMPPIIGKRRVVDQTRDYTSMKFPIRLGLLESSDMAYFWNPCEYISSNEGLEKGNCLHVWKLNKKSWYIVLGVFSRVVNNTPPVLKLVETKRPRS